MDKEIEKMLNDFRTYKIDVEGKTKSSIDLYERYFRDFMADMGIKTYKEVIETSAQTLKDWVSMLAKKENSPVTRNNKLVSVRQVFAYLEDEREEEIDRKIRKIKYAKTAQKETKFLSEDELYELVHRTGNLRTKAGIAIIMTTGVRYSELIQITCSDIRNGFATVVGKGNKERTIYFTDWCIKICEKYINKKREKIIKRTNVKTDLLFISNYGNVMDKYNFTKSLKHYGERIGLYWSDELSPHKLRHSYITKELNDGVPIHIVRDIVGHSNISTTNRYSHTKEEDIKNAMLRDNK